MPGRRGPVYLLLGRIEPGWIFACEMTGGNTGAGGSLDTLLSVANGKGQRGCLFTYADMMVVKQLYGRRGGG